MVLNLILQTLRQADDLKDRIQSSADLINDNEANTAQKQLQKIYQQVLILDLEYGLNQKIEQELWNYGFKNYIDVILKVTKDKKNPKRSEYQGLLSSYLEAASGFYLTLLQEICTTFAVSLPLPGYRTEGIFQVNKNKARLESVIDQPEKKSLYYICLDCFVHLGDIARYRYRYKQAESFYRSAILISPITGQPYNQLALLELGRDNKLGMVFYYVRSVAVKNPFPAASSNLTITLEKSNINCVFGESSKLSATELISLFLKLHACLHLTKNITECFQFNRLLTTSLTAHIATESFSSWQLIQMMVINIYAYNHLISMESNSEIVDKNCVKSLIIELIAGSLNAFLLPVYTYKDGDNISQYFALPAILITLGWIQLNPDILQETGFINNLQIWPGFCKLLNSLQKFLQGFAADKYNNVALPEEQDLQGFIPLSAVVTEFRYGDCTMDLDSYNKLRTFRLTKFGIWLANSQYSLIKMSLQDGVNVFEATLDATKPSNELLLELEELSIGKDINTNDEDDKTTNTTVMNLANNTSVTKTNHLHNNVTSSSLSTSTSSTLSSSERRGGILKSKSFPNKKNENNLLKKTRQNVALQTILKRNQESQQEPKQVTFKTPSPSLSTSSDNTEGFSLPPTPPWQTDSSQRLSAPFKPTFNKYLQNNSMPPPPGNYNTFPNQNNFNMSNINPAFQPHNQTNFASPPFQKQFPPFSPFPRLNEPYNPNTPPNINSNTHDVFYPPNQSQFNFPPSWNQDGNQKSWHDEEMQNFQNNGKNPTRGLEEQNSFLQRHSSWQFNNNNGQPQSQMMDPLHMNSSVWPSFKPVHDSSQNGPQLFNQNTQRGMEDQRNMYPSHQSQLTPNSYSLFNHPIWSNNAIPEHHQIQSSQATNNPLYNVSQQSLWSGGPSPLQRLLEQQKLVRDGQPFQSSSGS